MGWIKTKDKWPNLNAWVVGKRGTHRPFTCRLVESNKHPAFSHVVWLDADNNYRDPEKWVAIPEDIE